MDVLSLSAIQSDEDVLEVEMNKAAMGATPP